MEKEKLKEMQELIAAGLDKEYYGSRHSLQTASLHFKDQEQATTHSPTTEPTTVSTESTEPPQSTAPTVLSDPLRRISSKQRKASLDEYREQFLKAPKITDRQPVFVSRTTRDSIDDIVRKLGERRMSVSGFLENIARHHLALYNEDIEQWKRL